jgi:iron complex outermembrane receptor protein
MTRVDVDETQSAWSPKASLSWRVAEPASLYVSYAKGFRGANVQETISLFGVEPLEPQRSESYEVGGKYRRGPFTANLALFWMNVEDEILFDPTTFSNRNLERVRHRVQLPRCPASLGSEEPTPRAVEPL